MRWSAVVIARNEAARLGECLSRIAAQLPSAASSITVLLNGCADDSAAAVQAAAAASNIPIHGYSIAFGDKSNAWNQYMHGGARQSADLHVFVDGYAHVKPGALSALAAAVSATPSANAATGVPSEGRSAALQREVLLRDGGLHGSLHALRGTFVERIRARGFRIPVGLYRGDGLVGSFAMYDLDPLTQPWDPRRIAVVTGATWALPAYRLSELPRHWSRRINQARGRLESAAIRRIIEARGFEGLPSFADDMLITYLETASAADPRLHDVFGRLARRRLAPPRRPSDGALAAEAIPARP